VRRQSGAIESNHGDGEYTRVCREPGHRVLHAPRRRRFPLAATLVRGAHRLPNPKRRRASTPKRTLWFRRAPRIPVGT